jgi:ligand-binding sensor domain-containing protein
LYKSNLFILFILAVAFTFAQPGRTVLEEPVQFQFTRQTTASGLVTHELNSIIQDADGYIWIATPEGLQRFDGIRYKTFRHRNNDPASIATNLLWQLMPAKGNNIWLLSADGKVGLFDTKRFIYKEVSVITRNKGAQQSAIKRMLKDEYGNVFLLLGGAEIITYNERLNEFSYAHNFFKQDKEWMISGFAHQPGTKKYWLCIQGGGLAVYNTETKNLSYKGHNTDNEKIIDWIGDNVKPYNLFFDSKNRLWFCVWGAGSPYVVCYDMKNNKPVIDGYYFSAALKTYYEISQFYEQNDGTIWAIGLKVLARYVENEADFQLVYNGYLSERSIVYESVRGLYEDREKNIWVATSNNGLYRFNPKQEFFTNIIHKNRVTGNIGSGSIMSFVPTRWGTILAGSWGDGLYHYDKEFNLIPINIKSIDEKSSHSIWSTFSSKDGNTIWLSAQPGLYKVDQQNRSAAYHNPPVLQNRTVRQIVEDKWGNLWVGMQGIGVFKWTKEKGKNNFDDGMAVFSEVPVTTINKITVDSKGYVWIATPVDGAFVIDAATDKIVMHFYSKAKNGEQLPDDAISSVLEYNDSLVMLTSATRLYAYNRKTNKTIAIGAPDNISGFIAAMERDKKGYVWITTTTGLYRVNIYNKVFVRFNREDGIQNDHFTLAASAALPDGRLVFGNSEQFIAFDPASITINSGNPDVKITDFEVMNTPLLVDSLQNLKKVELSSNKNSFVIQFSTLSYSGAYLIRYKLEGLDKEWKIADKDQHAVYSYVPPGHYTFLLNTVDENGTSTDHISKLAIHVNPPFWKAWWFYSLEILVIAVILFWFDRERMKRKEALQKMRNDIAGNLHEQLNTALNNINILSEMARLKADNDPQKSKEYIEQIHARSHTMIIAVDDMLWSIDPENDNMERTVERMKEYIDALKNRYGVEIDLLVDKKIEGFELNMKLRHEAFLMFKEGIKSLVDAGTKYAQIHIGLEGGKMLFTVQFDNEEINMQHLHNLLQRHDMEKRLGIINAELNVEIHKSSSLITLQVPVVQG